MERQAEAVARSSGRKRGGVARIDRERIVEVARTLDPRSVTMQAVADALGVDRKAIHYHVRDRDGLLGLVAAAVFAESFAAAFHGRFSRLDAAGSDWRTATRAWACAARDGMAATGAFANHHAIASDDPAVFEPAEIVLARLRDAGFDPITAGRALIFLTNFAMGVGRDIALHRQLGSHPQGAEVRRVLDGREEDERLQGIWQIVDAELNSPSDVEAQFDFEVDVFLRGMDQRLR